ncbi:amidohydrolase [Sunxiuqinia dokdonensis]|uniref:Omega-amidase YafV n=1 Tax=Sunxiuqinia dokdonensis TaxID=1409788 RepID=A0A0L8V4Z1_9BACT|nr:amidohydrolase [Sunxiuqinia dokdonensis]KOH43504.1 carbon-nitrogen hydrolase [Sunxiuqinia dokdonensis]
MTNNLHIALIQCELAWEQPAENRKHLLQLLNELSEEIDLVVFPEMFATGFSMHVEKCAETMEGETIQWMKQLAAVKQLVVAGSLMIRENGNFFNRFVFAFPDGQLEYYDKRHLFSMGEEHLHFTGGQTRKIIQIKSFRILPQVCYDLRFPVFSRNRQDYDLLINVANWPAPRREAWQTLLKARAIENQAYVAGINRVGQDANGINYLGDTCIVDSKGKVMVAAEDKKEQIITAKLSKDSLEKFRNNFRVLPDADDFDLK